MAGRMVRVVGGVAVAATLATTAVVAAGASGAAETQRRGRECVTLPPDAVPPPGFDVPVCPPGTDDGPADPEVAGPPLRSQGPLTIVYDFAPIAQRLHTGVPGVPGLGTVERTARQFPLGEPFPPERWIGKANKTEIVGRSASRIAQVLEAGMSRRRTTEIASGFVALDEVGTDFEDAGSGPELLAAMRILARKRHPVTGEPLNRRVLMYAAPKMVANVGSGNDRELWDDALAAARLSGGLFLQMYHAESGVVTGPFTVAEWRDYMPVWRREMGTAFPRLRVILSNGRGVSQDEQWRRARETGAGRAVLRNGVGAYNLRTTSEATAWLRNWNRFTR